MSQTTQDPEQAGAYGFVDNGPLVVSERALPHRLLTYSGFHTACMSNIILRCALFRAGNNNQDRAVWGTTRPHPVAAFNNVSIFYSGEELRQDDLDVYMFLLHEASKAKLGDAINFSAFSAMKAVGWAKSTRDYHRLEESINRLAHGSIKITARLGEKDEETTLILHLVHNAFWQKQNGRIKIVTIQISPSVIALFENNGYSLVDWGVRKSLSPLAKWLQGFYSTHKKPIPLKLGQIHSLTGMGGGVREFKRRLKEALTKLNDSLIWHIDEGGKFVEHHMLHVKHKTTDSTTQIDHTDET